MRKFLKQSDRHSQGASPGKAARRGFTLVEVLLVLTLLLVLTAMALPGIAGWQSRMASDQTVTAIQSACQQARILAIRSGVTFSVTFDAGGDGGQIQSLASDAGQPDSRSFRIGGKAVSVSLTDAAGKPVQQLYFYPGGRSTDVRIVVTDADGGREQLQLDRLTGMVRSEDIFNDTPEA